MKYKDKTHIIFDLDDTLTNSYSFNQDMFINTIKQYTNSLNPAQESHLRQLHKNNRGISMTTLFQDALNFLHLVTKPTLLVTNNEVMHTENASQIKLFDHIKNLLSQYQSDGKILSICTNRQTQSTLKILQNNQVEQYFTKVVSCSDAKHEKPDPFCLNYLIDEFHITKDQVIYIGDSITDQLFANNAGVDFELAISPPLSR